MLSRPIPSRTRRLAGSPARLLTGAALLLMAATAAAYTELQFDAVPVVLSAGGTGHADKARITALASGTLIATWIDAAGPDGGAWSIDGTPSAPKDVFVRTSTDGGVTWSAVMNISNTANLTDLATFYDRLGNGAGLANYYGDSGKASVFASGNRIAIAWNDTYCGAGRRGPALYDGPQGQLEIPFRCLYVARLIESTGSISVVQVDRITDATRDANNEVVRATGQGFAVAWQEDPAGLQPGEAAGEGDGASGARVTPGTDIWYTSISGASFDNALASWAAPVPITDNYDYATAAVLGGGASRPALAMTGSPATVMIAYEESKNAGPADPGKHVRYHVFPFSSPQTSAAGTVVSDPAENARRARVLAQGTPGGTDGTRAMLLWRQGTGIQGAPAAVLSRIGRVPAGTDIATSPTAGFRVEDFWPAVDTADASANAPALNLSGNSLTDAPGASPERDAKAHRAMLDGDFVFAGFTQNDDVANPAGSYRYLLRTSDNGGATWTSATDVSATVSGAGSVIEPRLVRTPSTRPTGKPEDVRDPNAYVIAWGTEGYLPAAPTELVRRLFVTRTADRGLTFENIQSPGEADTTASEEAIQIQVTPDGNRLFAVWIGSDATGSHALFSSAAVVERTADLSLTGSAPAGDLYLDTDFQVVFEAVNSGPDTATEVQTVFSTDMGLTAQGIEPSIGNCDIAALACELGAMTAGETATIVLTLRGDSRGYSAIQAAVTARELEPTPADNGTVVQVLLIPRADLAYRLTTSGWTGPPDTLLSARVDISNRGPQSANRLTARLTIPNNVTPTTLPPLCHATGRLVECELDSLAVGAQWLTVVPLRTTVAGTGELHGDVQSVETDPFEQNNTGSVTIEVVPAARAGGCTYLPGAGVDPVLPTLLLASIVGIGSRRRRARHV